MADHGPKYPEIVVQLTGQDGNAAGIMGKIHHALRRAGVDRETRSEFMADAMAGDYDNVLQTAMKWVTVE